VRSSTSVHRVCARESTVSSTFATSAAGWYLHLYKVFQQDAAPLVQATTHCNSTTTSSPSRPTLRLWSSSESSVRKYANRHGGKASTCTQAQRSFPCPNGTLQDGDHPTPKGHDACDTYPADFARDERIADNAAQRLTGSMHWVPTRAAGA